ncbi:diguanylate cyclase domain-containing protein [Shewanella algae]|uniref:diguanylate cyclase domain-containing protein n=1 Tax=Shewanella algae TaxID=38313 RepID=UPI0030061182
MIYSFSNSGFRDPETGVYNRTYFMEVFHREWYRHLRDHQSLALLYLCPHIHETVNQPHLLEFFAKQVQEALLRNTDLLGRMNHHLFALGLFNVDKMGTEKVIERINEKLKAFSEEYSKFHHLRLDYRLAACICLPNKELKPETLFIDVETLSHQLEEQDSALSRIKEVH